MDIQTILPLHDQLNLYLVENRVKPSSTIHPIGNSKLDICDLGKDIGGIVAIISSSNNALNSSETKKVDELEDIVDNKFVQFLENYLDSKKIPYSLKNFPNISQFSIGSTQDNLEALLKAKDNREQGKAFGYPDKAIETFGSMVDGEIINGGYFKVAISKAKKEGIKIPTWLAYISFIPDKLDIVNRNISDSSKEIGELYQRFVRENNPDLARRIEEIFLNMDYPDSWEKTNKGYYICHYNNIKQV